MGQQCLAPVEYDAYEKEIQHNAIYSYFFKTKFSPDYFAGVFIDQSIKIQQHGNYDPIQLATEQFLEFQTKINDNKDTIVIMESDLTSQRDYYNNKYQQIKEDQDIDFLSSESDQFQEIKPQVAKFIQLGSLLPLKLQTITYKQASLLIIREYPYLSEFEIFQIQYYVKYYSGQPSQPNAIMQMFKQMEKTYVNLQQFVRLSYLCAPEQYKKFARTPSYLLFFGADHQYNRVCLKSNLVRLFTQHFGTEAGDKINRSIRVPVVSIEDFELVILGFEFDLRDINVQFDPNKAKKFIKHRKEQLRQDSKIIEESIQIIAKKSGITTEQRKYARIMTDREMEREADRYINGIDDKLSNEESKDDD
ncbi:Conserved_hypothetical protein [Hexamita inflata]|uniref:Uncharacterized protein n=1 Tax=Hexamita inflata TaxID=28002 RepID=A0AA86TI85_9EUKA|nr:Conserved hypothetical protein [Hexamita inflata]